MNLKMYFATTYSILNLKLNLNSCFSGFHSKFHWKFKFAIDMSVSALCDRPVQVVPASRPSISSSTENGLIDDIDVD